MSIKPRSFPDCWGPATMRDAIAQRLKTPRVRRAVRKEEREQTARGLRALRLLAVLAAIVGLAGCTSYESDPCRRPVYGHRHTTSPLYGPSRNGCR